MNDFFDHLQRHPLPLETQHQALTEADYDELFRLFDEAGLPDTAMNAEMADGYLTACVVGPTPIPDHAWMEAIFGQPTLPICADPALQASLLTLLLRRHREITDATALSPKETTIDNLYTPLRGDVPADEVISPYQLDDQGHRQGSWACKDWANGFQRAMLQDPLWEALVHDPEAAVLLAPVMFYQQGYNPDKPEFQIEQQKNLFPMLAICVSKIREFWRSDSTAALDPYLREAPKVGRNDPCPCGSGKKYKKCCGA